MSPVAIVTGATGAMGSELALELIRREFIVILAVRNTSKMEELARNFEDGTYEIRHLDLADFDSVVRFTQDLERDGIRVDLLMNNAGCLLRHYDTNASGFERTFATNYLGTWLLTRRLLPLMNDGGHIVCTSSLSCHVARLDRDCFSSNVASYRQIRAYADSKYALTLFSQTLAERLRSDSAALLGRSDCNLFVNSTDPGIVDTDILRLHRWFDILARLFFRPFCKSPKSGIIPALNAIRKEISGFLFRRDTFLSYPRRWQNPALADWLWSETERQLSCWL